MKIFGMVTTRASEKYTLPALESFFRHTPLAPDDEFYLIDNDGGYAPPNSLQDRAQLLHNDTPKGFAANANQVVDIALRKRADLYFLNNDLIFPRRWIEPLLVDDDAILSPLSPREVQFAASVLNTKNQHVLSTVVLTNPMELEAHLDNPAAFEFIAEAHRRSSEGYWSLFIVPFFGVKIPFRVLEAVGHFDEGFGVGGGEDYDYCLRALLAGFQVKFALGSYLLHFGGKSSWAGVEDTTRRSAREEHFMRYFEAKWGPKLFQLALRENEGILSSDSELRELLEKKDHRGIVERLLEGRKVRLHQ